ncbi:hypothetical protein F5884DRAFT_843976 [Xylogone sp. PMI_703]|nr:hypothetical protein F5884DRAFT_843976 [Xylogone sp. PMI_703]
MDVTSSHAVFSRGRANHIKAHKLREAFGDMVDIRIFEKNPDVGGTWWENRYPGCACDVPSRIYQFTFCPNPYWSKLYVDCYASSSEIQSYLKAVVLHYRLDPYIKFNSKVEEAVWCEETSKWTVSVEGKRKFECHLLGKLAHTAAWDDKIDARGKRVAIIGAGASAVQVLAEVQSTASHEEKAQFRDGPEFSLRTRKEVEAALNCVYREKLIPFFEVGCRRINPSERYLETLQKDNVEPVFSNLEEVTPIGIRDTDGIERPVDIIIAATGFDTSFRPKFPIIGRNGIDLRELWKTNPVSYRGLAVSGFPNYLIFLGALEATAGYFIRLIRKMMAQRVSSFNIRADVEADFDAYAQDFMQKLVWTGSCRSWFKSEDGKVTAIWPGSGLHYREFLQSDRWEDWEWSYPTNWFQYWGLGFSRAETAKVDNDNERGLSYYIQEVLEMVSMKAGEIVKGDSDSDESATEQSDFDEFASSKREEKQSCETSEISWEDEDHHVKGSATVEDPPAEISLAQVAAFSV